MKLSVIIPVYNVASYLEQCLNSVIAQTYIDLEIIIVNDGSTDDSSKICDEFSRKDNRVISIHQDNGGVSSARNRGIEIASGEYLTFVDSDDWLDLRMYEKMMEKLKSKPEIDVLMCDYVEERGGEIVRMSGVLEHGIYNKQDIIKKIYPTLIATENFGRVPMVSPCMCIYKKSLIDNHEINFHENLRFAEDYLFMANVKIHTNCFFYLKNSYLYHYRQIKKSRSKFFQLEWWSNLLLLNRELKKLLSDSIEYDFERQLNLQVIHSVLLVAKNIYKNQQIKRKQKIELLTKLFNDSNLINSLSNTDFRSQPLLLKIILYLIKNKLVHGYLLLIDFYYKYKRLHLKST